ncbi:hypothetical protein CH63R_09264 [Colletotrichum higginsianum IMI 349063]|uniref:Uncharacterized protein n=1 Tax=Colletotrichum higginsianum (strain IMI 349063) TaxID=759273 RepID=A0A1B7Y6T6_COLHI|nr:hypothetical protein CH63R_09264 [Colletotrichum higginsianum IMI 349063]OBR07743.1 hypothetical protein CH63R_09264 [Colletotrichum higginsianum IMI 349063]
MTRSDPRDQGERRNRDKAFGGASTERFLPVAPDSWGAGWEGCGMKQGAANDRDGFFEPGLSLGSPVLALSGLVMR